MYGDQNIESRTFIGTFKRASETSRDIEGIAAVVNRKTQIGWYDEIIKPGAFSGVLDASDIRALLNHDPNHLLARKRAKNDSGITDTLETWIDDAGNFRYGFSVPNSRDDILEMVERGDLAESSFAFTLDSYTWEMEDSRDLRVIEKFKRIYDVAPATYPAYQDTTVAKRSFDALSDEVKDTKSAQAELKKRGRLLFLFNHKF